MDSFEENCYRKKCITTFRAAYESLDCGKFVSPIDQRNDSAIRKIYEYFFELGEDESPQSDRIFETVFGKENDIPLSEVKDIIGLFKTDSWTLDEALIWTDNQQLEEYSKNKLKEFLTASYSIIKEEDMEEEIVLTEVKETIDNNVAVWNNKDGRMVVLFDWKKLKDLIKKVAEGSIDYDDKEENEEAILAGLSYRPSGHFEDAAEIQSSAARKGWGPAVYEVAMVLNGAIHPDNAILSDQAQEIWKKMYKRDDVKALDPEDEDYKDVMRGPWDTAFAPSPELSDTVVDAMNNTATHEFQIALEKDPYGEIGTFLHEFADAWILGKVGQAHNKPAMAESVINEVKKEIHDGVAVWNKNGRLSALLDLEKLKPFLNDINGVNNLREAINSGSILGVVFVKPSEKIENAYEVSLSGAEKEWGPATYEVAISLNGPLHPDEKISTKAENLWKKMYQRNDVNSLPIENNPKGEWYSLYSPTHELINDINNKINNPSTEELNMLMKDSSIERFIFKLLRKWVVGNLIKDPVISEEDSETWDGAENPLTAMGLCKKRYYDADGNTLDAMGITV